MPAKARYRDFCRIAPDVPVYAQAWYLDACAAGGHWDVVLAHDHDRVVAALPYFYKQKGPFRYVTMPPFVKMLGPYLLPEYRGVLKKEHVLLEELLKQLPDFAAFKQNFYPTVTNWLPFYWNKYRQTTYYTYRLSGLQELARVEAGINRNIRRNLQKAQQLVRVVHDYSAQRFYELNKMSFDRQGLSMPYSWAQFERHDAALAANGARQMFFAVDEQERIHSAAYLIWDKQAAYYHLSGDDPALRDSGAGILLIWEAIRYASEVLKLDCFDFEGSMLPAVERIRVQFGAVQTPYFFVWKYNSRAFELLEKLKP
ncbi:GNAT family N-acetyltransferase [Hymenobacter arizonensis]|uniref:Acetyltransferase (GNAT) domain-containing protein n=1 Tax=Hymenobacter arizonensis TaxID=1227077 RepID=A0A1I5YUS3_HYMAR|nr:GNAT family N-acetyltransferase [Hymenobacter arizonensis]SFQ47966.1 Acetyltransferase (GNAT) domain-containing protein [Hymenobacter arizonensis]